MIKKLLLLPLIAVIITQAASTAYGQLGILPFPKPPPPEPLEPVPLENATTATEQEIRDYIQAEIDYQNILSEQLFNTTSDKGAFLIAKIAYDANMSKDESESVLKQLYGELESWQLIRFLNIGYSVIRLESLFSELRGGPVILPSFPSTYS
jgi:hypothetical protein